jgi:hypothetical protein
LCGGDRVWKAPEGYFEWAGKKGDVHIMFPQRVMAAWETNLMEAVQVPTAMDSTGKVVAIPTNPYEIETVKTQLLPH